MLPVILNGYHHERPHPVVDKIIFSSELLVQNPGEGGVRYIEAAKKSASYRQGLGQPQNAFLHHSKVANSVGKWCTYCTAMRPKACEGNFAVCGTPQSLYRVAICPRGDLPFIRNYPVFNLMYSVGAWINLTYS